VIAEHSIRFHCQYNRLDELFEALDDKLFANEAGCRRAAVLQTSRRNVMLRVFHALVVMLLAAAGTSAAELNDKNYAEWRDRIRPKTEERCFETVSWLPTFWEAVMAAQKEDKPILLWAMNGHPLACT
jgi:hypothetical protein